MTMDERMTQDVSPANLVGAPFDSTEGLQLEADVFPASFAQRRMWFFYQLDSSNPAYNVPLAVRITGRLQKDVMEQCINEIIDRHEGLRTTFALRNDQPVQIVWPTLTISLMMIDLSQISEAMHPEEVYQHVAIEAEKPFDLVAGPVIRTTLFQLSEQEHIFLLNCHHIAVDGWALSIFYKELKLLYSAHIKGKIPQLLELPIQYADFAQWQLQKLQGDFLQKLLTYWKNQLGGDLPTLHLPMDRARPDIQVCHGARQFFMYPQHITKKLKKVSQEEGTTLFMTLLAAYLTLLHRYSGQENIIVGTPIANRNRFELDGLIGFFANTLALRTDLSGDPSFLELLKRVREVTLGAYAHQDLPFERLVEEIQPERNPDRNPIFQHIFALQRPPDLEGNFHDLYMEMFEYQSRIVKFDLEFIAWEDSKGLHGYINYNKELFDDATISHMIEHWLILLENMVSQPELRLSEFALMTSTERHYVLVERQPTPLDEQAAGSIVQQFEMQVTRTPQANAVLSRHTSLTYHDLNLWANQLAHTLSSRGVGPNRVVGIYAVRPLDFIVGIIAIFKAGGTCVLISPNSPPIHISFILEDARVSFLLTQQDLLRSLSQYQKTTTLVCIEQDGQLQREEINPQSATTDTQLAYIEYASGKGILVEHHSLQAHIQWRQAAFALSEADRVLVSGIPETTATTLGEIFWPLLHGASLVLSEAHAHTEPLHLQYLIAEHNVSIMHITPPTLAMYATMLASQPASSSSVRLILVYGESVQETILKALIPHFTGSSLVYALYYVPETVTCVIPRGYRLDSTRAEAVPQSSLPGHLSIYILDSHQQPVPLGIFGDVYLSGDSLACGYTRHLEESHRQFVQNPLTGTESISTRVLKTGRKGRFLRDGGVELLKSLDRQAVVNGYELSLLYIEENLLKNPAIADCIVLIHERELGVQELVAYIVPQGVFSAERIEAHARALLPAFMVPCIYVPLTTLPMMPSGEVDETALYALEIIESDLLARWEAHLTNISGIEQVAVCAQEYAEQLPLLHFSEILPDWQKMFHQVLSKSTPQNTIPGNAETTYKPEHRLALSSGPELVLEFNAPQTLTDALDRAAKQVLPSKIIYVQQDGAETSYTYATLLEEAEHILAGLRQQGLKVQDKVLFQLDRNQDFLPAFWGCVLGGFVPVPLPIAPTYTQTNIAVSKFQGAWQALQHPIVLTGSNLVEALRAIAVEANLEGCQIIDINELKLSSPDHSWHQSNPKDLVLMLLTSGSTGAPKGVMLSHRNILSRSAATIQMNHFTRDEISLNWMPLDHVGGIVMYHLLGVYLGCQQIHVPTQMILQDPLLWMDLIDRYHVSDTWAPNFAYGLINSCAERIAKRHWDLSSLRFVLNGGEAIVARTTRRFLDLLRPYGLPATVMHPAWGMSETSSGVTFSDRFTLAMTTDEQNVVEVGSPIPGASIRIVDANDQLVEEGVTGRLQVKGPMVANGYYKSPDLNQEVFTPDGWFDTGDIGVICARNLAITGRAKDTIIINGINVYSHDIEATVEELDHIDVSYTAACAVRDGGSNTDKLVIFFVTPFIDEKRLLDLLKEIRGQVARKIGVNADFLLPVTHSDIPKTAIGKIQRSLLRERFLQGEFDMTLTRVDKLVGQPEKTLPDWFYRQTWIRKNGGCLAHGKINALSLLFLDNQGVGTYLSLELGRRNQPYVCVEAGTNFARLSINYYRIDPHVPEHYQYLVASLQKDGLQIGEIIHLWTYDLTQVGDACDISMLREAQYKGTYSILFLIQALSLTRQDEQTIPCYVVSNSIHTLFPTSSNNTAAATLPGFLKTLSLELPWLLCHSIDLEMDQIENNAEHILYECALLNKYDQVAYRGGKRFVPSLEKVNLVQLPPRTQSIEEQGVYLVTGGLGGIGKSLISYLLQHYRARVIALGRTPLPDRAEWSTHLAQDTVMAKKIKHYQELEALGGEFRYQAVDVGDLAGLRQVVTEAETYWKKPLAGVFHLAGEGKLAYHWQTVNDHRVMAETLKTFEAMFQSKVYGTWAIFELLKDRPQTLLVAFSSTNSLFGGASFSAYSAANSFLNAYTDYQRQYHTSTYCFIWSLWDNVGMSQDNPAYANATALTQGYYAITKEQGLASLLGGLAHHQHSLIVGLDGTSGHIRQYLKNDCKPLLKVNAYFTAKSDTSLANLQKLAVHDRFQTLSHCSFYQLMKMPLTTNGDIDRKLLCKLVDSSQQMNSLNAVPATELEHTIADIWREVLSLDQISIHDNFFSLGGHSLRLAQVQSKLRTTLGRDISLVDLFKYPTIYMLSRHLAQGEKPNASFAESQIRADMRREMQRRRARISRRQS